MSFDIDNWFMNTLDFQTEDKRVIDEAIRQLNGHKQTKAFVQQMKQLEQNFFYNRVVLVQGIPKVDKDKEEKFLQVFKKMVILPLDLEQKIS